MIETVFHGVQIIMKWIFLVLFLLEGHSFSFQRFSAKQSMDESTRVNLAHLYGEWSLWYANLHSFAGPNKIMVYLYPKSSLEIVYKRTIGPCLFVDRELGSFTGDLEDQKVEEVPDVTLQRVHVNVTFTERSRSMVSFLGIGVEELDLRYPIPLRGNQENMELVVVGRDDLFLTTPKTQTTYHLIRSSWINQPSINVPFSTLVATQVVGTVIGYFLHYFHLDSPPF